MSASEEVKSLWRKALTALKSARIIREIDYEGAINRAYYCAFYCVSALFIFEQEKDFSKHKGLESAVHKELVHSGRWPVDLGKDYTKLFRTRLQGDYGSLRPVTEMETNDSLNAAERILLAVNEMHPDIFPLDHDTQTGRLPI